MDLQEVAGDASFVGMTVYHGMTGESYLRLMPANAKTVIIICGPTAVGKTALAIHLAQHFQTEIISADSRQCFKELNIGVAKPSPAELALVPHHFINSHSIQQEVNAALFEAYALQVAQQLFTKHDTVVMVGGTGLYIKAFTQGLDEVPQVDPQVREQLVREYEQKGITHLQELLQKKDPAFWEVAEQQNPHRLMRALEVILTSGRSISAYRTGKAKPRNFNVIKVGLEVPRPELYQRINNRVDQMIRSGLLAEVENLLPYQHLNALQTVGYRELFPVLNASEKLETAVEQIKKNTRHYAKRQLTWFHRDHGIHWFHSSDSDLVTRIAALV